MNDPQRNRHSFFWPIILIGVGIIWLLVNLGMIAPINFVTLLQFWPILLIILGLDILLGHRYPWAGSLVALLALGGLIAYLVMQPNTGKPVSYPSGSKEETLSEPLEDASSVSYYFETASEPVKIDSLDEGSNLLLNADLVHQGTINFNVSGTTNKMVNLSETTNPNDWFGWNLSDINNKWDISLARKLPTDLRIDGGSGALTVDLENVQLESLSADLGSGASSFILPEGDDTVSVDINSGSGAVNMQVPEDTDVTIRIESGSGALNIDVPNDAAVMVEVMDSGSGSLQIGNSIDQVTGDNETGTWKTSGYDSAKRHILIKLLDRGSGAISIE
jgi:hypothetical protein